MASVNKAILVGNLGKDPETRFLPDGKAVCNFSIATSEQWKDKATGEKKDATEWHRISTFGRLAEVCGEYLKRGSSVYIEGRITTRKWQDKEGQDRYTTEIIADKMIMLGSKNQSHDGGRRDQDIDDIKDQPRTSPAAGGVKGSFADMDDDIPF